MRLCWRTSAWLVAALAPATAAAQTTSQIVGEVKAADSGKPVEGAVVSATAPELQGEQLAVTAEDGKFTFTLLPPGTYTLNVQKEGFQPLERSGIKLPLGRTLRVNLEILPAAIKLEEVVITTQAPPIVDQASTTAGVVIGRSIIDHLPKPRRVEALAEMAPGAQGDLYGVSLGGATSNENSYLVDGKNVGNPAYGLNGVNLPVDFVQEVEIKTGGYRAEYGRASSGIVNVLTKRGGNHLHGSVFANVTPYQADRLPIGRAGEAISTTSTGTLATDFGFELGGPILVDQLWFYAGFAPLFDRLYINRNVNRLLDDDNDGVADVDPATGLRKSLLVKSTELTGTRNTYSWVAKLTYQLNEDNRLEVFGYGDPTISGGAEGEVPYDRASGAVLSSIFNGERGYYEYQSTYGGNDFGANWSSRLFDKKLLLEASAGYHREIWKESALDPALDDVPTWRNEFTKSLADMPEGMNDPAILAACKDAPGSTFMKCPVNRYVRGGVGFPRDLELGRISAAGKATYFLDFAGTHVLKGGVDFEQSTYTNVKSYTGGRFMRERRTATGAIFYDDFRRFGVEDPPGSGKVTFYDSLTATTRTNSTAFFAQDTWTVLDLFTLDAGVRWEIQTMTDDQDPANVVLALYDNIAPRLGLIYDWTRTGKGKVYGYFGRFYEMIPLNIADRNFAHEPQVFTRYDPNSCSDPNDPRTCAVIPNAFGPGLTRLLVGTEPSPVLEGTRGQFVDQYLAGVEYELLANLALKIEYTHNSVGRVIEDMSVDDGEHYFIGNPGEGAAATAMKADGTVVSFPKPTRVYDAITFTLNKVFANGWQALASYTYSSLRGNYPGLFKDDTGQLDPNNLSELDLPDLLANREGPLGGDVPHQLKLDGSYTWNLAPGFDLLIGGSFRAASGVPINTLGAHESYGSGEAYILPRGVAVCRTIDGKEDCSSRTPPVYRVDGRLQALYRLSSDYTLSVQLDVFNVFNWQETVAVDDNYTYDPVYPIVGGTPDQVKYLKTTYGEPVTVNRNYGNPIQRQAPLSVRLGARISF